MDSDWDSDGGEGIATGANSYTSQAQSFLNTQDVGSSFDALQNNDFSTDTGTADGFSGFGGFDSFDKMGDRPPMKCYKCNQEGHMSRNCPENGGDSGFSRSGRGRGGGRGGACFKCHQEGHLSRNCPEAGDSSGFGPSGRGGGGGGGGGGGRGGSCFKCGEEGHISRNCTKDASGPGQASSGFTFGDNNDNDNLKEPERPPPMYIPKDLDEDHIFETGIKIGKNFEAYENIPVKVTGDDPIPKPVATFEGMNLRQVLLENVKQAGYPRPTPVQKYAIPIIMNGRDLMACAQTGSGKTAAFLLPMLHYIIENNVDSHAHEDVAQPTGLILAPTRELASQIFREGCKFSMGTIARCLCIHGGVATNFQLKRLRDRGCHLLVATPGKLKFFLDMGKISFSSLKYLVFDEADRMLDMGFVDDMDKLVAHNSMPQKEDRQTMMFSATFPDEVQDCALRFMNNYLFFVAGMVGAANRDVMQEIIAVPKFQKRDKLAEYLKSFEASKVLVFVEMKRQADFVGAFLSTSGIRAVTLHGDRFQEQREEALSAFRSNEYKVLVATSVAARGLDIEGVGYVINYDLPKTVDEYVHRIGRTGRVGNSGKAVSFFDPDQDFAIVKDLVKTLREAEQNVPSWLLSKAEGGVLSTYQGSGQFASTDIRDQGNSESGIIYHGGPGPSDDQEVDDEDLWDE